MKQITLQTKNAPEPIETTEERESTLLIPPYNVVLLDDNDHSYEYVITMLGDLFGHSQEVAYQMALEVDSAGCVIVFTSHQEQAEFKRDQIHAYGADPIIPKCQGSMSAVIEPGT